MEDDSDLNFDDIPFDKFELAPEEKEEEISLEDLMKTSQPQPKTPTVPVRPPQPPVSSKPVVVEDFIRNYLKKMKMEKTLNCFQVCRFFIYYSNFCIVCVDFYRLNGMRMHTILQQIQLLMHMLKFRNSRNKYLG